MEKRAILPTGCQVNRTKDTTVFICSKKESTSGARRHVHPHSGRFAKKKVGWGLIKESKRQSKNLENHTHIDEKTAVIEDTIFASFSFWRRDRHFTFKMCVGHLSSDNARSMYTNYFTSS